jgi:hypothetical protein|tara:strand:- start:60 stop:341 length:282 start_codon:yes stop_codon:yes gene_type:complete
MNLKVSLAKIKMIEMGIIPAMNGTELRSMIESLPEKDRVIAKRKFRKAWRKIRKNDPELSLMMGGEKMSTPSASQKRNRSVIVVSSIVNSIKV